MAYEWADEQRNGALAQGRLAMVGRGTITVMVELGAIRQAAAREASSLEVVLTAMVCRMVVAGHRLRLRAEKGTDDRRTGHRCGGRVAVVGWDAIPPMKWTDSPTVSRCHPRLRWCLAGGIFTVATGLLFTPCRQTETTLNFTIAIEAGYFFRCRCPVPSWGREKGKTENGVVEGSGIYAVIARAVLRPQASLYQQCKILYFRDNSGNTIYCF
ncbi:unnamed protein product [Victoria cruziana]